MPRRLLLLVAVIAAALAGAWWASRPGPPSDEEAIRGLLEEAAQSAERRDAGAAVAGLAESFQGQGKGQGERLDRRGVKQLVAYQALRGSWVSVRTVGVQVRLQGGGDAPGGATAALGLILSRGGPGRALADLAPSQLSCWRVEATLARQAEGWRVVAASWRPASLAEALDGGGDGGGG
jgi:hypothetical protein